MDNLISLLKSEEQIKRIFTMENFMGLFLSLLFNIATLRLIYYLLDKIPTYPHWVGRFRSDFRILVIDVAFWLSFAALFAIWKAYIWPIIEYHRHQKSYRGFELSKVLEKNLHKHLIWQGDLKVKRGNILVLNNMPDGIITMAQYKNAKITFEAKTQEGGFGIIFYAKDLSNYFMLKVNCDRDQIINIVPHIRYKSVWYPLPIDGSVTEIEYLEANRWLRYELILRGRQINLRISSKKSQAKTDYPYITPSKFTAIPETEAKNTLPLGFVPDLELNDHGRIGLRVYPNEFVEVRDFMASKL